MIPLLPTRSDGNAGSHPGSFEEAHGRRHGKTFPGTEINTGERYDLVVVGGGVSGLAAAYYFPGKARRGCSQITEATEVGYPSLTRIELSVLPQDQKRKSSS
jgi:hypothetical protein